MDRYNMDHLHLLQQTELLSLYTSETRSAQPNRAAAGNRCHCSCVTGGGGDGGGGSSSDAEDSTAIRGQEGVEEVSQEVEHAPQRPVICFNSGCADFVYDHNHGFQYGTRNVIVEDPFRRPVESSTNTGRARSSDSLYMQERTVRTAAASTVFSREPENGELDRNQTLAEVGSGVGELPQSLVISPLQLAPVFLIPANANLPMVSDETEQCLGTMYPPHLAEEDMEWEYVS